MTERFVRYSLSGLLAEGTILTLDRELRLLSLLRVEDGPCLIREQQQFTDHELVLLLVLLEMFPYHSPLEHLLAAHIGGDVDRCREQLIKAQEIGEMDSLMRPVRNVLSRCRLKIHPFHLDIKSIIDTGYMLMRTA